MIREEKVNRIIIVPDSENDELRKDLFAEYDYSSGIYVKLFTRTPNANIYYSLVEEGKPHKTYLNYDEDLGVCIPPPEFDDNEYTVIKYSLGAYASFPGMQNSDVLERTYIITRKPYKKTLVTELLNSRGLKVKDAYRIRDYDNDNMFLFNGRDASLLYDTGFFAKGADLYKIVRDIIGEDKKLYVVLSHNGPDHIQMAWQFVNKPNTSIYINDRDRYMLEKHICEKLSLENNEESKRFISKYVFNVTEGSVFDLGDRRFYAYEVPGHTFGCVALLDKENRDFLIGDCIGTNMSNAPGSLWMWNIVPRVPINDYLSILHILIAKIRPLKIKEVYGGHYVRPIKGEHLFTYLDNLMIAAEKIIDYGLAATKQGRTFPTHAYVARSEIGERIINPYYAAIDTSENLMFEEEYLNGNEDKNADLCYVDVRIPGEEENLLISQKDSGLGVSLNFIYHNVSPAPEVILKEARSRIENPHFNICVPEATKKVQITPVTGSHYSRLYLNGKMIWSDFTYEVELKNMENYVELRVVSEDRSKERSYVICIKK